MCFSWEEGLVLVKAQFVTFKIYFLDFWCLKEMINDLGQHHFTMLGIERN